MSDTSSPIAGTPARTASAAGAAVRPFGERASWLVRWTTKGGLAVLDQALFAGAHFLLNILLARWLPPAEYGAFALAYSVFLFVYAFYSSLLLQPMAVFGAARYRRALGSYLGILLRGHFALSLAAGALLLAAAWPLGWLYSLTVRNAVLVLGLVLPLLLLIWMARRAFYIDLRPGWAALGAGVYFVLLLGAGLGLFLRERLSPVTALLAMAAVSLVAAAVLFVRLRPRWSPLHRELTARGVAGDHWRYGRWALASAVAIWFPLNIYYLTLPAWVGLEGAGALKALVNLGNPVLHSLIAFGALLVPLLVRHRDDGGIEKMQRTVRRLLGVFLCGATAYLALLWSFRVELLEIFYQGKYLEHSGTPILLVGLLPFGASATVTLGAMLLALERPDQAFWSYAASCLVTVLIGLPLVALAGPAGALGGLLLSYAAAAAAMFWFLRRHRRPGVGRAASLEKK